MKRTEELPSTTSLLFSIWSERGRMGRDGEGLVLRGGVGRGWWGGDGVKGWGVEGWGEMKWRAVEWGGVDRGVVNIIDRH